MTEHESAVQAWLDHPATVAEVEVVKKKIPMVSQYQAVMLALGVQILAALEVYGTEVEPPEEFPDPNDDDEPWRIR